MTGFNSMFMCIVAQRCENITFWDISQKWLIKHLTLQPQKHSTHHDE